jgi:hypothetical protein
MCGAINFWLGCMYEKTDDSSDLRYLLCELAVSEKLFENPLSIHVIQTKLSDICRQNLDHQ